MVQPNPNTTTIILVLLVTIMVGNSVVHGQQESLSTSSMMVDPVSKTIINRIVDMEPIQVPGYVDHASEGVSFGSILTSSGQLLFSEPDLLIPGIIPIQVVRTYYSRNPGNDLKGPRWMFNYCEFITVQNISAKKKIYSLRTSNGTEIKFSKGRFGGRWVPPQNKVTEYLYLEEISSNNTIRLVFKDGSKQYFVRKLKVVPPLYLLNRVEDGAGNYVLLTYNDLGYPVLLQNYDNKGNVISTVECVYVGNQLITIKHGKRKVRYMYNEYGNITHFIDANGNIIEYLYDSEQRIIRIEDNNSPVNRWVEFEYDNKNRIKELRNPYGVYSFKYDESKHKTTVVDPEKKKHVYHYDRNGNTKKIVRDNGETVKFSYDKNGDLVKFTDVNGGVYKMTYDHNHNLLSITDPEGNKRKYQYEPSCNMVVEETDPNKTVISYEYTFLETGTARLKRKMISAGSKSSPIITSYEYDQVGQLVTINYENEGFSEHFEYNDIGKISAFVDGDGFRTGFGYTETGELAWRTPPKGFKHQWRYEYDNCSRLIRILDPQGGITSLEYDPSGLLVKTTSPENGIYKYSYDQCYRLVEKKDPMGNITRYQYDRKGNLVTTITPSGHKYVKEYDGNNRLIKSWVVNGKTYAKKQKLFYLDKIGGKTSPQMNAIKYIYNNGDLVKKIWLDRKNNILRQLNWEYDLLHNITVYINGENNVTEYFYDGNGNMVKKVLPGDAVYSYEYDSLNRVIQVNEPGVDPTGFTVKYQYDSMGRILSVDQHGGKTTRMVYDNRGNKIKQINALGSETIYNYDPNGNLVSMVKPGGAAYGYEYDLNDRLVSVTDPMGNTTRFQLDRSGRIVEKIDPSGHSYVFTYDATGRVVEVIDPLRNLWKYKYDPEGNISMVIDPRKKVKLFQYDAGRRLVMKREGVTLTNLDGGYKTLYEYDNRGLMIKKITPDHQVTRYYYDGENRVVKTDYPGTTRDATITYNARGFRTSIADPGITYNYEYDLSGKLVKVCNPGAGEEIAYEYDPAGNVGIMHVKQDGDGYVFEYEYDVLGRVNSVTDPDGEVFTFNYTGCCNRLSSVIYPGEASTIYQYDLNGRLISLMNKNGHGELVSGFEYMYDCDGNKVSRIKYDHDKEYATVYGYNALEQLVYGFDEELDTEWWYWYDASGNRIKYQENYLVTYYQYDDDNRLVKIHSPEHTEYQYDANGNMVKKILANGNYWQLTWLPGNLLGNVSFYDTKTESSRTVATYEYDPHGRLLKETNQHGISRSYLYDSLNIIHETVSIGDTGPGNAWHVHGPGIDNILKTGYENLDYRMYFKDGLGSIDRTWNNKRETGIYSYDPFGKTFVGLGEQSGYMFTGRIRKHFNPPGKDDWALYYYRNRWYEPSSGRFLSKDRIGIHNPYLYLGNNPVNYRDPMGLCGMNLNENFMGYGPGNDDRVDSFLAGSVLNGIISSFKGYREIDPYENMDSRSYVKHYNYMLDKQSNSNKFISAGDVIGEDSPMTRCIRNPGFGTCCDSIDGCFIDCMKCMDSQFDELMEKVFGKIGKWGPKILIESQFITTVISFCAAQCSLTSCHSCGA